MTCRRFKKLPQSKVICAQRDKVVSENVRRRVIVTPHWPGLELFHYLRRISLSVTTPVSDTTWSQCCARVQRSPFVRVPRCHGVPQTTVHTVLYALCVAIGLSVLISLCPSLVAFCIARLFFLYFLVITFGLFVNSCVNYGKGRRACHAGDTNARVIETHPMMIMHGTQTQPWEHAQASARFVVLLRR
jgi:hypothetical protein